LPPAAENGTSVVLGLFKKLIDDRKEFAANAIGQKAVVADVAEIAVWDMSDEFCEEVAGGKRDGLGGVGIMIKVFKDNLFAVVRFKA
jgi:hypothetical protein